MHIFGGNRNAVHTNWTNICKTAPEQSAIASNPLILFAGAKYTISFVDIEIDGEEGEERRTRKEINCFLN